MAINLFFLLLVFAFSYTNKQIVIFSFREGITESAIRRYLIRKPMTPKELVQKFKSKKLNISKEQMTSTIAQLLKKINPDKKIINKAMYLSLKSS